MFITMQFKKCASIIIAGMMASVLFVRAYKNRLAVAVHNSIIIKLNEKAKQYKKPDMASLMKRSG